MNDVVLVVVGVVWLYVVWRWSNREKDRSSNASTQEDLTPTRRKRRPTESAIKYFLDIWVVIPFKQVWTPRNVMFLIVFGSLALVLGYIGEYLIGVWP